MVVLFHFKINFFYGGFAGVDVFFVISGFLMQEICNKDMIKKGWVINFYKKRFNRIYPALLIMTILTFMVSVTIETPDGVKDSLAQTLSSLTFTSNILYWKTSGGYFTGSSDLNWLLHTWSLSLEWQYYLIFPLIIKIGKLLRGYCNFFYVFISVSSLVLCVIFSHFYQNSAFYLLPTRMWELMLGAYVSVSKLKNNMKKTTEIVSVLVMVLFCVFAKDESSWPGLLTLIPTLCAAAIIHASIDNDRTIFKYKAIQSIGYASYSIYLFHWPVVAFMANKSIQFSAINSSIGIFVSFLLGFFSYKFFEKTECLRGIKIVAMSSVFAVFAVALSKMEVNKLWVSKQAIDLGQYKGYGDSAESISQFGNDDGICFLDSTYNDISFFNKDKCLSLSDTKKNILLIGDSHAAELSLSMKDIFRDYNFMQATASGCFPIKKDNGEKRCADLFRYIYDEYLVKNNIDYIFIAADWSAVKNQMFIDELIHTISSIKSNKIYIIGQTKTFDIDFYKIAQKIDESEIDNHVTKSSRITNAILSRKITNAGYNYLNVFDINCLNGSCKYIFNEKIPFMFDKNHLTKEWADYYVEYIKKILKM